VIRLGLAFLASLLCSSIAASSRAQGPGGDSTAKKAPGPSLERFEILVSAGYGASTKDVRRLEIAPYGPLVGLDVGYTFRPGLRFGAVAGYGFGHSVSQRYDPVVGDDFDVNAESSSFSAGLSVGWDVPLHELYLRYGLSLGGTWMSWSFDGAEPGFIDLYAAESPSAGFFAAPGLKLLVPLQRFECGIGFDYVIQTNEAIPSGFLGQLYVGVKL
jgi:hypothetical protein